MSWDSLQTSPHGPLIVFSMLSSKDRALTCVLAPIWAAACLSSMCVMPRGMLWELFSRLWVVAQSGGL